jgi:hypothetical protein
LKKKKERKIGKQANPVAQSTPRPTFPSPAHGPALLFISPPRPALPSLYRARPSSLSPAPPAPRFLLADRPAPPVGAPFSFPFFFPRITGRARAPRSPASPRAGPARRGCPAALQIGSPTSWNPNPNTYGRHPNPSATSRLLRRTEPPAPPWTGCSAAPQPRPSLASAPPRCQEASQALPSRPRPV